MCSRQPVPEQNGRVILHSKTIQNDAHGQSFEGTEQQEDYPRTNRWSKEDHSFTRTVFTSSRTLDLLILSYPNGPNMAYGIIVADPERSG